MGKTILVSGALGFVSSHLVVALREAGWDVFGIDSGETQVHGSYEKAIQKARETFEYGRFHFGAASEGIKAFLADGGAEFDAIVHLAAVVGVGQSQYERGWYTRMNTYDTDKMLDVLDRAGWKGRIICAGSMSVYGEGPLDWGRVGPDYRDIHGNLMADIRMSVPRGVREDDPLPQKMANHYAVTKFCQEQSTLGFGNCHEGVTATSLRFFNIYGEGQALSNPYTGVAAMFAARLLQGKGGIVYEDGGSTRDFIHVSDVVRAICLTLDAPEEKVGGRILNVCTGVPTTLLRLHCELAVALDAGDPTTEHPTYLKPVVTGLKRKGDIRHCFGDPRKAKETIGFEAQMPLVEGMRRYAAWLCQQDISGIVSRVEEETAVLREKGLLVE